MNGMSEAGSPSPVLDDFLEFRNGKTSPPKVDTGAVVVFGSNGPIGRSDVSNIDGDVIVIGRVGSYCGSLHYSTGQCWVTDNAIACTAKRGEDARFWYYALQSLGLNGRSSGSGQPLLNQKVLGQIRFSPPAPPERSAIAAVLGALDDKISANASLVRTIDSLMLAAFQSADLESVMRPLSDTAEFVNGKAFTKGASGSGRVVIRIAELNSGLGGSTVYSDAEVDEKHVARAGDILFAWSGSLTLHRWFRDAAIVNQHIFKVVPKNGFPAWLVYELIGQKLADFKGIAADKATTMGHIQRHHLDEAVLVPSDKELQRMDLGMTALWQRALLAERESLTLAQLRDTLLPELMSGRLRVKDAEKKIEEVL